MKFPTTTDKDPKRRVIGRWIAYKRQAYNNGKLSQHWIDKFEQTFPGWSWNPIHEQSNKKKEKLLDMAIAGESRPNKRKTKLGQALGSYINKSQKNSYDAKFEKEIRKLAPSWWINTAKENKKQLLEMARNREPRPNSKIQLGIALMNYTGKNSDDPKFSEEIREAASHWFVNTADKKKKQFLKMAREGKPKPNWNDKLGQALHHYTHLSSSYDAKFDKQIRKLAPSWFVNTAHENKKQLLEMARKREPRPNNKKTKIGKALSHYIGANGTSYDPKFDKQIRALAPHWFRAKASR